MKEKIRIASGQGFWGDLIDAPYQSSNKRRYRLFGNGLSG